MTIRPDFVVGVVARSTGTDADRTVRSVLEQDVDVDVVMVGQPAPAGGPVRSAPEGADVWEVVAARAGRDRMVGVVESGDILRPGALARIAGLLDGAPDTDVVYTDERVLTASGGCERLKPTWSPARARHHDYCGQLTIFRGRTLADLPASTEARDRHGVLLHAAARARRIEHLPVVAFERSSPVPAPVERSRTDLGSSATVVIPTAGAVRAVWGRRRPLVLDAVDSVLGVTERRPQVVVVVDPETPAPVREALVQRDVMTVAGASPFNYAAACNVGAAAGDGDVVVLLNDDTLIEQSGWLRVMTSFFADPDVGVVGARLLHADGTLQHGGLLLNEQPLHIFHGYAGEDPGPFDLLRVDREVSAVTGACLATPRSIWDELGGLDQAFALAGNDVDYCLRAQRTGRRVVWTPDATLYHFESQSRGVDTAPADVALLYERWPDAMVHDPYGHPDFEPRQAEWVRRQPLGADQQLWRSLRRAARWRPGSRH